MAKTYSLSDREAGADNPSGSKSSDSPGKHPGRLTSLDAYRGFIMITLAASGFGIASFAALEADAPAWENVDYKTWQIVGFHFEHPDWRSNFLPTLLSDPARPAAERPEFFKTCVSFWDLIQPAFMFMVGVAMPFSYGKRKVVGESGSRRSFPQAATTCGSTTSRQASSSTGIPSHWIWSPAAAWPRI